MSKKTHNLGNKIAVVTGFPRCGSSLVMRMLKAGGVDLYYDFDGSFETNDSLLLPDETDWLDKCKGKAVKILEPMENPLPENREYIFLLLKRNPKEQAKSQIKFLQAMGTVITNRRQAIKKVEKSLEKDYPKVDEFLKSYPNRKIAYVDFEMLVESPKESAFYLSALFGGELDQKAMADVVIERGPECLDYLLETRYV